MIRKEKKELVGVVSLKSCLVEWLIFEYDFSIIVQVVLFLGCGFHLLVFTWGSDFEELDICDDIWLFKSFSFPYKHLSSLVILIIILFACITSL